MIRNRYRRIVLFFARVIASFFVWDLILPRLGLRGLARQTRPERIRRSAEAFRRLAVEMGGVLIKIGQFLSARVDVLPQEITTELAGLQDEVPPEEFRSIRRVAEAEFGMRLDEKFAFFDEQPLAAASLGQVHCAKVFLSVEPEGQDGNQAGKTTTQNVVVKIQRPNIEAIIATDLAALRTVGRWLQRYQPIRRRVEIPALLAEFTRILYEEIDYLAEGRNAETFASNFADDPSVRVPKVVWTHTTRRALTLENVWGIKINDYEAITAEGIDRGRVAARLLDTYLKQIFEDGFFHADPHPGNLFVYPCPHERDGDGRRDGWQLTFVDFGMVGRISPRLKDGLREMLVAVGTRDAARLVRSYQMVGVLLPNADLQLLERAEARLFERFWGKNMSELQKINPEEVRELAGEFRQLIYTLPFQVPHDLILLGRAVGILSGICTGLDPQFNIWEHLAPYARNLVMEESINNRDFWLDEIKNMARSLLSVPVKMDEMLAKMDRGEISVQVPEAVRQVRHLESALRQIAGAVIFAAFLLGGIQVYLAGLPAFGYALLAGAGLSLLWVLFVARRK